MNNSRFEDASGLSPSKKSSGSSLYDYSLPNQSRLQQNLILYGGNPWKVKQLFSNR